jgi:maltoporin
VRPAGILLSARARRAALGSLLAALLAPVAVAAQPVEPPPAQPADPLAPPTEPPPPVDPPPAPPPETRPAAPPAVPKPAPAESPKPPAAPVTGAPPVASVEAARPTGFAFGSYGRMIAATDGRGGPGRDADIVAHGSRLDEANYVELELRRDDYWVKTQASTRLVATLAFANPVFHYDGDFDVSLAVRNLYLEERDLGAKGLSAWAGSRMYRGDDIYLLDWWPLDNLNTVGAGVRYDIDWARWGGAGSSAARDVPKPRGNRSAIALHMGLNQPDSSYFHQTVQRPAPLNQFGAVEVEVLDRQKWIGSAKLEHILPVGREAGVKLVGYLEAHRLPAGQREEDTGVFESLPSESGYVIGAQLGAFTGQRDTHVNAFVRYATGLAAYGDLVTPTQLSIDGTSSGASEIVVALGGNWEFGPVGVMLGAYLRSFRNASESLDYGDVDEGIIVARPHLFFGEYGGIAVEGSYQAQQRGVLRTAAEGEDGAGEGPSHFTARLFRVGFVPFLSPAGRGDYSRPHLRLIWAITARDDAAKALYPEDDVFGLRGVEHFLGVGAEWWFNSSSYGGG